MKGVKTTLKDKLGIALLGICLWIELIALGLSIGLDLWIKKPSAANATGIDATLEGKQWMIGLWKACLVPKNDAKIVIYSANTHNCTDITSLPDLREPARVGVWTIELQILALVLILISAMLTVFALLFFICGYIPKAKCKTCGLGGLPSVLITSGVCQISCLVAVYFMANKEGVFGLSYYLTAANQLPTWATALATLVITCRVS